MNRRSFIGLLGALGIVPLAKIAEPAKVEAGGFLVPIDKAYDIKILADSDPDTFIWERQLPACALYARRTYYNPGEVWKEIGAIHEMTVPREEEGRELPGFGLGSDDIHITLLTCLEPSMMLHHKEMLDFRIIKINAWTWQCKQRWDFQGHVSGYATYYAAEEGGGVDLVIKPVGPVEWSIEAKEDK